MATYVKFDATITVNELLHHFPAAIETLSCYGIDACCRGNLSIAEAAAFAGIDPERLLAEVSAAKPTAPVKACACGCHAAQDEDV
jgi:iron-sulfur cluster repair protein YtfE (RIC family)